MIKYPKTPRLGTLLKKDLSSWRKYTAIISEKIDGANVGISFSSSNDMILQSRGHILVGGARERMFDYFKNWAHEREKELSDALGSRYLLFGEWCWAKHRVFYDALPDYFFGLDIFDKEINEYLSTNNKDNFLNELNINKPPVIHIGPFGKINNFSQYVTNSNFKTDSWKEHLLEADGNLNDTDDSMLMEGVYIKVEDAYVVGRLKFVRPEFEKVRSDDWLYKKFIVNKLK